MEAHYFINDIFLPENSLLKNVGKIRKIPAVIVQGRYDLVCPIETADELAPRLAGGRIHHRARRRPFGHGAGHPLGPDRGDGQVQDGVLGRS